jgi:integrase
MTGSIFNRSKRKNSPSWGFSVFIGKDAAGKKRFLYGSGFALKRDAEDARDKAIAAWKAQKAAAEAAWRDPGTLAQFFPRWIREFASGRCTAATVERYEYLASFFLPELGSMRLADITTMQVEQVLNGLLKTGARRVLKGGRRKGLAPKTVRSVRTVLSGVLKSAVRWGLIPSNPCDVVSMPPIHEPEKIALDFKQTDMLLQFAKGTWIYPILVLGAATGARRGELLSLEWSDIDFKARTVTISKNLEQSSTGLRVKCTKGRMARVAQLAPTAIEVLQAHRMEQEIQRQRIAALYQPESDLVFGDELGRHRSPSSVSTAATRMLRKAGFKQVSLHSLRHSYGSQLLSGGVPLPAVSSRLGHKNTGVTAKVYSHALKQDEIQAADIWEAQMAKARIEASKETKN